MEYLNITLVAANAPIDFHGTNGGLEMALIESGKALVKRGHNVTLAANLKHSAGIYGGMHVIEVERWLNSKSRNFDLKQDIVAISSGTGLELFTQIPREIKKVVLHHHGIPEHLGGQKWADILNGIVDAVICVSNAVKNNLISAGVRTEKLYVVHNGVDRSIFSPRTVRRDMKRLMFVGALVPDKNPELLLNAFYSVGQVHKDASLHFYGSSKLWGMQRELLNIDLIKDQIPSTYFHGVISQENLATAYSTAAICVNPSWYESFSLVSVEAQACGCVPVLANVGGMTETILPNVTGFLFEQGNVQNLTDILGWLLSEPELIKDASRKAAEFVAKEFSWDKVAKQYEQLFIQILNNSSHV